MKKYVCQKCGWIEEQNDNHPQNIFNWAIEVDLETLENSGFDFEIIERLTENKNATNK